MMRPLTWVCLKQAALLHRQARTLSQQEAVIDVLAATNTSLMNELDHESNRADALYLIADRNERDQVVRVLDTIAELPEVGT